MRLDITYPGHDSDVALENVDWRSGLHSDLSLRVGSQVYTVHKVKICHGERASVFMHTSVTTHIGSISKDEIDLSVILPETLWPLTDSVLDFIYTGSFDATPADVIKYLAWAELTQTRALFFASKGKLESYLTLSHAPAILAETALSLLTSSVRTRIEESAVDCIARQFYRCDAQMLHPVPAMLLATILECEQLAVTHEDFIFDMLAQLGATQGAEVHSLLVTCRLSELSAERLQKAKDQNWLPISDLLDRMISPKRCRQSFAGVNVLMIFDTNGANGGPPPRLAFGDGSPLDWFHEVRVQLELRGAFVLGMPLPDPTSSVWSRFKWHVILTDLNSKALQQNEGMQQLFSQGSCGFVFCNNFPLLRSPEDDWGYSPLAVWQRTVGKGQGKGTGDGFTGRVRRGSNVKSDSGSFAHPYLSGVDLTSWKMDPGFGNMFYSKNVDCVLPILYQMQPETHVLVELDGEDGVPVFAVNPRQRTAALWEIRDGSKVCVLGDAAGLSPQGQLLVNTLLIFARESMSDDHIDK